MREDARCARRVYGAGLTLSLKAECPISETCLLETVLQMADLNQKSELFLPALTTPGPRPSEPPAEARFSLTCRSRGHSLCFHLMNNSEPILFSCPSCGAKYNILAIDSPGHWYRGKVACLKCNALFPAGDECVLFKYTLMWPPSSQRKRR